jgi:hypothetical protein
VFSPDFFSQLLANRASFSCTLNKRAHRDGQRLSAAAYRLTRVVHKLRSGADRSRPHLYRQIVNNSAASKSLSVDKSASFIFLPPGNTHRPATNMHRKQFQDYFNQSFERVPVRSLPLGIPAVAHKASEASKASECRRRLMHSSPQSRRYILLMRCASWT